MMLLLLLMMMMVKMEKAVWQLQPKAVYRRCEQHVCMNSSGHIGHATVFSWTFTIACCLVVESGLGLGLGLDLVSAW